MGKACSRDIRIAFVRFRCSKRYSEFFGAEDTKLNICPAIVQGFTAPRLQQLKPKLRNTMLTQKTSLFPCIDGKVYKLGIQVQSPLCSAQAQG